MTFSSSVRRTCSLCQEGYESAGTAWERSGKQAAMSLSESVRRMQSLEPSAPDKSEFPTESTPPPDAR